VTLISRDNQVIMMNSAVYAMKMLQTAMDGEAEKTGLRSDDDVVEMIMEMRREETKVDAIITGDKDFIEFDI
jgi:hypothetical protein